VAGGVITSYTVFYRIRHDKLAVPLPDWSMKSVSSDTSSARLILKSDQNYEIIVHASTAFGLNKSLQLEPIIVTHDITDRKFIRFVIILNDFLVIAKKCLEAVAWN
jgi:hypothetical protein